MMLVASLCGCDDGKKERLAAMGSVKPPEPPPWASASASAAAAPPPAVSARLTGNKPLRERLLGKWKQKLAPEVEASNKAELDKAEKALQDAKTDADKKAAKARKITVEEVTLSWVEFTTNPGRPNKRTTRAPPNRMLLERPYEITKEDGNTIVIRVWDEMNPQGGHETYTFLDDNTMRSPKDDLGERFDTWVRK